MTSTRPRSRGLSLAFAVFLLLTPVPAPSQEAAPAPPPPPEKPPAEILDGAASEQTAANGEASASQERVNQLDDETQRLLVRYRTAVGEAESIKGYSDQLRLQMQPADRAAAHLDHPVMPTIAAKRLQQRDLSSTLPAGNQCRFHLR